MSEFIYGIHAAQAMIARQPESIKTLFVSSTNSQRLTQVVQDAERQGIRHQIVSEKKLEELSSHNVHQGIVLEIFPLKLKDEHQLKSDLETVPAQSLFLVLDEIQDPHNLGACMRTAEAFGVNGLIFPKAHAASITPTVRKVACGAELGLNLYQVSNLSRALDHLKAAGVWVLGAVVEAPQTITQCDFKGKIALVMGNEAKGLRALTQKHCDGLFSIPLTGMTASLNVSVATGICLYEARRAKFAL